MGSSFLTAVDLVLALYCAVVFVKSCVQFGLPGHPARFGLYLVLLCALSYFCLRSAVALGVVAPLVFQRYRALPLVAGGLCLLLQAIMAVNRSSTIQQRVFSRIPLMAALLFTAFFWAYAAWFFAAAVGVSVLFLSAAVGKARYQKRALLKLSLFLGLSLAVSLGETVSSDLLGQLFLFPALFYFFIFEHSVGVGALIDDHTANSGALA